MISNPKREHRQYYHLTSLMLLTYMLIKMYAYKHILQQFKFTTNNYALTNVVEESN